MKLIVSLAIVLVACRSIPAQSADAAPVPLNPQKTVLLDGEGKRLLLKAKVVLREGLLEMFCCLEETKEHESILSLNSEAAVVHAGLLALGAKPGSPVSYDPDFTPASGQQINIIVQWTDAEGIQRRATAQSWVRHAIHRFYAEQLEQLPPEVKIPKESELRYDVKFKELSWYGPMTVKQRDELLALSQDGEYRKAISSFYQRSQPREMNAHWVFAGSGFYVDEETGRRYYLAERGDLICVANFPSATLDLSIESSQVEASGLLFEPYTERIPPLHTEVTIELIPVFPDKPGENAAPDQPKPDRNGPQNPGQGDKSPQPPDSIPATN